MRAEQTVGIQVRLAVEAAEACPVAGSTSGDAIARSATWSRAGEQDDVVLVDRGRLTDRQQEVLETAMEMGYFERPRSANATEVSSALDISPSTFAEHLASAQSKVLDSLLEGSP